MASKFVVEITEKDFNEEVVNSNVPVLVDFWAPWCGPCRMLLPTVEKVAEQFAGRAKVCKVNVDENPELSSRYGITSIPRLLVFKGSDQPINSTVGLVSQAELSQMLESAINR